MNTPAETQLGDDLRELATGQTFTPDLATIKQLARQRHHRRLMRRGVSAAGVAVLAAGGLVFGMHGFSAGNGMGSTAGGATASATVGHSSVSAAAREGTGTGTGATAHAETLAYVTSQVKAAIGNVNDYVLRDDQVQTGSGGDTATNWTDPRTSNDYEILNDSSGKSIAWLSTYLVNRVLTWKVIEADYSTRTWFIDVFHAAGPIQGSTAGATSNVMTPAEIKSWLDSGKLKIIGHQVINGHHTIGLRSPWAMGYRELWVDSKTFLPVRTVTADFADQKGPLQNVKLIDNDTWLPRTKSLLDKVNDVRIPAGFTKVAPPQ
jgi:hypothetical protein